MKTPPVSGGLHSRNIRQLNKAIRCYPCAETPPFRMTSFEIGEFLATDSVDKKIVRLLIQSLGGTRKSATELFQLRDVHERTRHQLLTMQFYAGVFDIRVRQQTGTTHVPLAIWTCGVVA